MSKDSPSLPAAPDPVKTSAAQTQSNKDTALYNFSLSNPNVVSPLGSSTYTQNGGGPQYNMDAYNKALTAYNSSGAGGAGKKLTLQQYQQQNPGAGLAGYNAYNLSNAANGPKGVMPTLDQFKIGDTAPTETQTIKLSPEQQKLYDLSTSQSIDLSKLASMLQGNVGNTLQQPTPGDADFNAQSKKAQDAYYANQTQYLDPQFQQGQEQLDAKLANQGITSGSEAYNNEQNNFARQKKAAYDTAQNNAILQGPQNAQQLFSLSSAARELPLNEFNALRSQSQVNMPQFAGANPTTAQPTNVAGNIYSSYQGNVNAYNQQVASQNATTSGLFGLGGNLGMAGVLKYSDIRIKGSIKRTSKINGIQKYSFKYLGDDRSFEGVLAQEIQKIRPDAVMRLEGGYLAVNYKKLGLDMHEVAHA